MRVHTNRHTQTSLKNDIQQIYEYKDKAEEIFGEWRLEASC